MRTTLIWTGLSYITPPILKSTSAAGILANLMKYKIAAGTKINDKGYLLFYEHLNFGELSSDPGRITPFALSEDGDEVYLSSAQAGVLTGFRAEEDFGASERKTLAPRSEIYRSGDTIKEAPTASTLFQWRSALTGRIIAGKALARRYGLAVEVLRRDRLHLPR